MPVDTADHGRGRSMRMRFLRSCARFCVVKPEVTREKDVCT